MTEFFAILNLIIIIIPVFSSHPPSKCLVIAVVVFGSIAFSVICATPLAEREYCKAPDGSKCVWSFELEAAGKCTCIEQSCVGFNGFNNDVTGALNSDLFDGVYLTLITVTTIGASEHDVCRCVLLSPAGGSFSQIALCTLINYDFPSPPSPFPITS